MDIVRVLQKGLWGFGYGQRWAAGDQSVSVAMGFFSVGGLLKKCNEYKDLL